MPTSTKRCEWPRCNAEATAGAYCRGHRPLLGAHRDPTARMRQFRTPAWRALAARVLSEEPVCRTPGCGQPSTQVDHIIERRDGGTEARTNLQALCTACHGRKTAARRWKGPR